MSKYKSTIFKASAFSAAVLLSACSSDGSNPQVDQTVSLSGVVQKTSGGSLSGKPISKAGTINSGGIFSAPISGTGFDDLVSSPLGGALVLVTDAQGNTLSGVANADGSFSIAGLDKDGSFAVIFIDTRTLKILGSLVQAANPALPGQFTMSADTVLGDILIDPVNQRAVAEADVKQTVVVNDASAMDKDGDGIISQDDVSELQANTLAAEAAGTNTAGETLAKVSIMSFMGDANTWAIAKKTMMDGGGNDGNQWTDQDGTTHVYTDGERREMGLRRNMSVEGPKGSTVNVIKDASITYYGEQTETIFAPGVDASTGTATTTTQTNGYFNYTAASTGSPWGSVWNLFDPNSNGNDSIDGWANYRYLDPVEDFIYEGEMEDGKIKWRGMLPNNVVLGVPETISYDESWTETHPAQSGGTSTIAVVMDMDMTVTIDKVDGGVITDLSGKKLPIMLVNFEQIGGVLVTVDGVKNEEHSQDMTGKGAFYVLAKYGIDADAYTCTAEPVNNDATTDTTNCSKQAWQAAFADARFGVVSPANDTLAADMPKVWNATTGFCNPTNLVTILANTACMTTPGNLSTGTGTTTAMPGYDVLDGTGTPSYTVEGSNVKTVRDSWLSAMAEYIDKIDRQDNNGNRSWFFIDGDEFGPKMDPQSWDSVTGQSFPLTGGVAVTIETDKRQNGTTEGAALLDSDSSFRYFLSDTNVTTVMRASMKQFDSNAACSDDRNNTWTGCDVDLGVTSTDITLADPATNNAQQALHFSMTPPVVNTTNYKEVWLHWEETSANVWEPYCASHVSVWFSMVETGATENIVESHPVNFYMVKAPTPAVTAAQMQDATNPVFPDAATHCAAAQ
ncbi:MAG: hypothetical protein OEM38_02990 [Gammaproteobacteria bacterium]|nr:hypothetical protein [Gammaproteobacteria bacterium]